jgi:anti-sigma factor RsiW
MNCEFIRKNITDIVEKTLSPDKASEVDVHLESCNHCADLVTRFAQEWQAWEKQERIESSPAFWFKLQQRINKTEARYPGVLSLVLGGVRRLQPAVAFVVLVACVLAGSYAGMFAARTGEVTSQLQASSNTEQVFQYYLGGLDDSPRGSVGEFYTNPGDAAKAATENDGASDSGDSAQVTPEGNG